MEPGGFLHGGSSARVTVAIEDRTVTVRAWRYDLEGIFGHVVPIYLLDTDLDGNSGWDRGLTDHLYGGDTNYRLQQEIVLGMGGARMANALGQRVNVYHMNEGHAALLTLALLESQLGGGPLGAATEADLALVREVRVYHAYAGSGGARPLLDRTGHSDPRRRPHGATGETGMLSRRHAEHDAAGAALLALCKRRGDAAWQSFAAMFPEFAIDSITNGVHAPTWISEPIQRMLDEHIPAWRRDNLYLRNAIDLPEAKILAAHARAKESLLAEVGTRTGLVLDPKVLTLGFARRAATYKRATLLFTDPERLKEIAAKAGGLQIIYAGKAHPQDEPGKSLIQQVIADAAKLANDKLRIVYLENYAWDLGARLTAGVDVWVNNPRRPYEASGTSGMKAAMNGVPSLSILDGWWIEGCIEGVTGWAIEDGASDEEEAHSLYTKLETAVVPLYRDAKEKWARLMRTTLAFNGSYFNTNRMVKQYARNAYYPERVPQTAKVEEAAYAD